MKEPVKPPSSTPLLMRRERDSLGDVEVPASALYGAQTQRAIQNFMISGRSAHPALIRGYLRLKRAAASANASAGTLDSELHDLIVAAVDELLALPEHHWPAVFPIDPYQAGAGTSQNMNVNEVIANIANRKAGHEFGSYSPVHPNDHVNRSQSTNDTFPTAMRLALLEVSSELLRQTRALASAFAIKAQAWAELPKSARTHLQDAVPITLGQEFQAYSGTLSRCAEWISQGRVELQELGIGGSAAGTGLTVPREYRTKIIEELRDLTGEPLRSADNLCESMQSQSPIAHYSSMLRLLALELTRICNDLRLLASGPLTGLAEIILPSVQPGSSIMPGKVNPSILEMANQTWFSVLGYDHTVAMATQAGQLELNVMMPIMAHASIEATVIATRTIDALRVRCIEGIEPNEARLRKYFESTPQIATALSPVLGYDRTAALVKEALLTGKSILELVREENLIPESELAQLLDIQTLTGR